jgi:hypothetical protein
VPMELPHDVSELADCFQEVLSISESSNRQRAEPRLRVFPPGLPVTTIIPLRYLSGAHVERSEAQVVQYHA